MRPSGRNLSQMRPISIETGVMRHAEGSCLIRCGNTHVLCSASIEDNPPRFLKGTGLGWVTAEYGMLPRATGDRMRREASAGKQGGRTLEIQRLIGRSLRAVVDMQALGEVQITVDCDVIQADGGTRTASITGGFVALHDCLKWMEARKMLSVSKVLKDHVAAISCGIHGGACVLDLDYAEVKAETDICCTSANAVQVVEWAAKEWGVDRVILIPDEFLARNVAAQTSVGIIAWKGRCEVHERFTSDDIAEMRAAYPGAEILAHPECPEDVLAASDFAGSTAAMSDYVTQRKPKQVVMITECSMASNVAADSPDTRFIGPCNLCPHMKRISLGNIREALEQNHHEVTVDASIAADARRAVERMLAVK